MGGRNLGVADITLSTDQSTSGWSNIVQVAVTQNTPAGTTPSNIYHAVSFDNEITWKVFKSSAWTSIVRNNSGTWQYSNAGSWTNASSNTQAQAMIQATDQSAYQWQKSEVEAVSAANWMASGGIPSGSYLHWATRLITAFSWVADGTTNTSEAYATNAMSSNSSGGQVVSATSQNMNYWLAYYAFNQSISDNQNWATSSAPTSGSPQSIMIDLGAANAKVINKYAWFCSSSQSVNPCDWQLQGTNNTSAGVNDGETANGWTTLHSIANGTSWAYRGSWATYGFTNSTAYRYYRMRITGGCPSGAYMWMLELKLIAAGSTTITPTFTKIAFQYEM